MQNLYYPMLNAKLHAMLHAKLHAKLGGMNSTSAGLDSLNLPRIRSPSLFLPLLSILKEMSKLSVCLNGYFIECYWFSRTGSQPAKHAPDRRPARQLQNSLLTNVKDLYG